MSTTPKSALPIADFFVPGLPKTSGSKRAFMRPGMRFPVVVDDCAKGKDWKADVKMFGAQAWSGKPPETGPLRLDLVFTLPRPKNHSGKRGLKANAPNWHTKKPDVLKMARAIEDALTGILWADDAQIASEELSKVYGDSPGCRIVLTRLKEGK